MSEGKRKKVTLQDVATHAGLSVMTASYAYSNPDRVSAASREKIYAAAKELGYAEANPFARSLRTGHANAIGMVFSEHLGYAFSDPQASAFLRGVADVCSEFGLGLTMLPTSGGTEDARLVATAPVDGYIFWTTTSDDPNLHAAIASGRPVVIQGGPAGISGSICVTINDETAAHEIGRIGLTGCKRPVIVSFPVNQLREAMTIYEPSSAEILLPVTRSRLAGYRTAIEERDLDWRRVPILVLPSNDRTQAHNHFSAFMTHYETGHPDCVLCMSDEIAAGVIASAEYQGLRFPDDLAITGWDDGPESERLGLTTVRQDLREQGRRCTMLASRSEMDVANVDPSWSIIERTSTHQ